MEVLPKEEREKIEPNPDILGNPPTIQSNLQKTMVYPIKPEREKMLLKELLGNFSDQTGACFG
jgi:hypothetical protein